MHCTGRARANPLAPRSSVSVRHSVLTRSPRIGDTRRMFRAAVLTAAALSMSTLACRRAPVGPPDPVKPTSPTTPELAAYIPADAGFAMLIERGLFDHPYASTVNEDARQKLADKLAAAAMAEAETPGDRFWREIARSLGTLDDASLTKVGWLPGRSTAAVYTVGLMVVMRMHVDGIKAEGVIRVAARTAGVTLTERKHRDHPYLVYTEEDEPQILIASSRDQLVIALAHDAAAILDHVTSFTPPAGGSLATSWDTGGADRFLLVDPARLARLVADRKALVQLAGDDEIPAASCLAAAGNVITEFPHMTWTVETGPKTFAWDLAFELSPETAALMRSNGVPGWTTERDVPGLRFGLGVAPYPLMMRTTGLFDAISAAERACGDDTPSSGSPLAAMMTMSPLGMVQGVTLEMVALDDREVTMSLAVAVRDVPALWTLLASALPPLGKTVPAIGDVRDLTSMGMPAHLGVGRDLIVGSMGVHAPRRIRAMLAATAGPRMPVAGRFDASFFRRFKEGKYVFMGEPMTADDAGDLAADAFIDSRIDGNRLVIRTVMGAATPD